MFGKLTTIGVLVLISTIVAPVFVLAQGDENLCVTGYSVRIRRGPGFNQARIGALNQDPLPVIGQSEDGKWFQVQFGDQTGWVARSVVRTQACGVTPPPPPLAGITIDLSGGTPRSNAVGLSTLLFYNGGSTTLSVQLSAEADYELSVRYSNDNFGSSETVSMAVDGVAVGQFIAQDTGNYGSGWNYFVSDVVGTMHLFPRSHTIVLTIAGGDGYGVELDAVTLRPFNVVEQPPTSEPPPTSGPPTEVPPCSASGVSGDLGGSMARSNAIGSYSLPSMSASISLSVNCGGTYQVSVRYSNDNYGPTEQVNVSVDGQSAGSFAADDTGDWGYGWNNFAVSGAGSVYLEAGAHTVSLSASGGDGYGIEFDTVSLDPQ